MGHAAHQVRTASPRDSPKKGPDSEHEAVFQPTKWEVVTTIPRNARYHRGSPPAPPEGLSFTSQQVHLDPDLYGELDRHVTGQELCMGLREYAIQRYGLLARTVLECWRVQRTEDFGRMVFAMIEAGLLKQQADDSLEDFTSVYDFREAFDPRDIEQAIGASGASQSS